MTSRIGIGILSIEQLVIEAPIAGRMLPVVRGVSLEVGRGEILALVGESGAGKSLTAAAVIGLLPPPCRMVAGTIRLGGLRIDNLAPGDLHRLRGRRIGLVAQDPSAALDPLFTIGDQIAETVATHNRGWSRDQVRARTHALMAEVGIAPEAVRYGAYPHELSGGQRQRVAIALALAGDPELLVADEPTTALDVSLQAQMMALIQRVCRNRGVAVLFVSHDIGVVAGIADRIAVIYAGRIVEVGPVRAVVDDAAHPYTAALMAAVPTVSGPLGDLPQVPGAAPSAGAMPTGCAFHPRCNRMFARCVVESPVLVPAGATAAACWRLPQPSALRIETAGPEANDGGG